MSITVFDLRPDTTPNLPKIQDFDTGMHLLVFRGGGNSVIGCAQTEEESWWEQVEAAVYRGLHITARR
jgi:hypothetical protein